MPDSVRIKIDTRKFSALLKATPGLLRQGTRIGLDRVSQGVLLPLTKQTRGRPGVQTRTGALRRGMFAVVAQDERTTYLTNGIAGVKYANLQEHGGTIKPVRRKWLTIPVGPALTAAGVARGPARSFPGLKFILSKDKKTALLVMPPLKTKGGKLRKGQDARGTIYFVLKKQVTVPGRLAFVKTWREWIVANAARVMQDGIRIAVAKLNAGGRT